MSQDQYNQDFISTPTQDTGKWRIKRNMHYWVIGFVVLLLVATLMIDAFKQAGKREAAQVAEDEKKNQQSAQENNLNLPPSLNALNQQLKGQSEEAEKAKHLPGSELPVPKAGASVPVDPELQRQEIEKQKRNEQILSGGLMALEGGDRQHQTNSEPHQNNAIDNAIARVAGLGNMNPVAGNDTNLMDQLANKYIEKIPSAQKQANLDGAWLEKLESNQQRISTPTAENVIRPSMPTARLIVHQGTTIPAVLLTEINSDMPGQLTARTTMDIYDSITGMNLLIPQGARLIGMYNNDVRPGQERVLAAFTRLILPSGVSIQLGAMQSADSEGKSGMTDEVNSHFWKMFGTNFLIAALAKLSEPNPPSSVTVVGGGSGTLANSAGQILVDTTRAITERNRNMAPTLMIHKGHKINVMVNKDMVFDSMFPN